MDWRTINFDWNRARAFLVTAEEGSLSAAADALKLTQSTLSRQVAALEAELGVSLFEKVGRKLEITPVGLDLIDHVRAMGEAASKLSMAASGRSNELEGTVCITATEVTATLILPSVLAKLREQQPGIRIELIATNLSSDLRRREADIAIRNAEPTDPELIARKLPVSRAYLYATPGYLKKLGNPSTPEDLQEADFIGFANVEPYVEGLKTIGVHVRPDNFTYQTENHLTHWALTKQGLAIGVMPDLVGDNEPLVQRVFPDVPPLPFDTWIVAHRELRSSRRIRVVFDFLVEALAELMGE